MQFAYPFSLLHLGLTVAFVVGYGLYLFRLGRVARGLRVPMRTMVPKLLLRSLSFGLLLLALRGPSFGRTTETVQAVGRDIYLVMDVSRSMDATDVAPSRLERTKHELRKLVQAWGNDRIGILIFSAGAFTHCPLTDDHGALELFISTLGSRLVPHGGSDLGAGLRLALAKHVAIAEPAGRPTARVVVLLSDGEDFGSGAGAAAREMEERGIRLFILGVGTTAGGPIPQNNGLLRDGDGETVLSRLNRNELTRLARWAGGQYFELSDSRQEWPQLERAVLAVRGRLRDRRQANAADDRSVWFIAPALLLIGLDVVLALRTLRL